MIAGGRAARPGNGSQSARRVSWQDGVRLVVAALLTAIAVTASAGQRSEGQAPTPRLATVDWGIAQNLTAMGVAPIGVGQIDGYASWVGGPPLPAGVHELGLRAQPNMELLSQLKPDRILITRMYASQAQRLSQIAPVSTVDVYFTPGDVWDNTVAAVTQLGRIAHRPAAAQALIARTEQHVATAAGRLPAHVAPLLVLQFVDESHVRVYGDRSLVQATMTRMGLDNAWQGPTTRWGMAVVPLDRLADIRRARVVVMGPLPVGLSQEIAGNRIWHSLPAVKQAPVLFIPAVWSFGGLPSASRFARLLADALDQAPAQGPGWPDTARNASR